MAVQDASAERGDARASLIAKAPVLLGLAGVLASGLLCWSLRSREIASARVAFEVESKGPLAAVALERAALTEQLYSTQALFRSSDQVEPNEFKTFTDSFMERHEAIKATVWIVPGESSGSSTYTVQYAEGDEAKVLAPGSDLARDDLLRGTLERCSQNGKSAMSPPLHSLTSDGRVRVMEALPVLGPDYEVVGFVGTLLEVEAVLQAEESTFGLFVEDVTDDAPVLLAGIRPPVDLISTEEIQVDDVRTWRIACAAPPGFVASRTSWTPFGAFLLGLAMTVLLVMSVVAATGRARIQQLVDRRTSEVQRAYDTLAEEAKERMWAVKEARQLERELREIIDLVPNMIYVKDWYGRFLLANEATAEAFGSTVEKLMAPGSIEFNTDVIEPDATLREERGMMEAGLSSVTTAQPFVDARGRRRILRTVKIPYELFGQKTRALLCVATDITEQKHAEDILSSQNRILNDLAQGADPSKVLSNLVGAAEEIVAGMRCSVLFLAEDGQHLHSGFAPSLPDFYNEAIDGLEIGPQAGSCGAAAFCGERVVVEDVMTHPNWEPYRDLARRTNVRACWSQPIRASDGEILGTFAMYYSEPRKPEPYEERFIESMAHIAGIAIERSRQESV